MDDALGIRWSRFQRAVAGMRAVVNSADPYDCPGAVAEALDALYDLWTLWAHDPYLSRGRQNAAVQGDVEGETTAGLVHARGGKSHQMLNFGRFGLDLFTDVYPMGNDCLWQPYTDTNPAFAERQAWYDAHVVGRLAVTPFEAAERWLRRVLPVPPT